MNCDVMTTYEDNFTTKIVTWSKPAGTYEWVDKKTHNFCSAKFPTRYYKRTEKLNKEDNMWEFGKVEEINLFEFKKIRNASQQGQNERLSTKRLSKKI